MIKNEKRTAKQEKKFIKQLRKLGFIDWGQSLRLMVGDFTFINFMANNGYYGNFEFYNGLITRTEHKYPTIPQVLSLIKEHTGEDLSHKLKKSKKHRMEKLKAENERFVSERTVMRLEVDRIVNDLQQLLK